MSSSSRSEILGRVKAATGGAVPPQGADGWEQSRPKPIRIPISGDIVSHFIAKAESNLINVRQIHALSDVPAAVSDILARSNIAPDISVAPVLSSLPWPKTMEVRSARARLDEKLAVTRAIGAIAETGSVVLCSGENAPSSLNYAPEVSVIVLDSADITPYLEDGLARVKSACEPWPRAVNVVSGPSRTADVAGIVVRPAHGPKTVHLLIVSAQT